MPPVADRDSFMSQHLEQIHHNAEDSCAICHDPYGDSHTPVRITGIDNCNHVFGRECLEAWLNSGQLNSNTCPMCRTLLFGETLGSGSVRGQQVQQHEDAFDERLGSLLEELRGLQEELGIEELNTWAEEQDQGWSWLEEYHNLVGQCAIISNILHSTANETWC